VERGKGTLIRLESIDINEDIILAGINSSFLSEYIAQGIVGGTTVLALPNGDIDGIPEEDDEYCTDTDECIESIIKRIIRYYTYTKCNYMKFI
jgi:hypothetical protein